MTESNYFWGLIALFCLIGASSCKPVGICEELSPGFELFEKLRIPSGEEWRDTLAPTHIWENQKAYFLHGPDGWETYEWKIISPNDTIIPEVGQRVQILWDFSPSGDQKEIHVELLLGKHSGGEACILEQSFPFYEVGEPTPTLISGTYRGTNLSSPLDTFEFEILKEEVSIGQITVYVDIIQNFPKGCRFSFSIGEKYSAFFLNTGNQLGQGCEQLRASGIFDEDTHQIWIKYQTKMGSEWKEHVFIGMKIT